MTKTKRIASFVLLLVVCACSGESFDQPLFTGAGGEAGASGAAGVTATGGVAGESTGGVAGEAPCGDLMFLHGNVCVDKKPAQLVDGSQGAAVEWAEAASICESRGARLCTTAEREGACPDGQFSSDPTVNGMYCGGPANMWEWSASTACADGRCVSPCCNSVKYPCQCSNPVTSLSFHCCKDLN